MECYDWWTYTVPVRGGSVVEHTSSDRQPNFVSCPLSFESLYTSSHLDGFACITGALIINELDSLEIVRPNGQSTGTCGLAIVAKSCQLLWVWQIGWTTYS